MIESLLRPLEPALAPARSMRRLPTSWRLPLAVFLSCQVIYLGWLAAFRPGLMTYDSVAYVWHVTTGNWMANHSVLYDSLVWLSLNLTGDLLALTLAQSLAISMILAALSVGLRRLGVPGPASLGAAVLLAVMPSTGSFVVTLWKDVAFSICVLAMTTTLVFLLTRWSWWTCGLLGFEALLIAQFRNNGFLLVAIAVPLVCCAVSGWRRRLGVLLLGGVVPLATSFALWAALFPALGVQGVRPSLTYGTAYADIAVVYDKHPQDFTRNELALMQRVAPLWHWKKSADCHTSDYTTFGSAFDTTAADRNNDALVRLWERLIIRDPATVAAARFCRGSIAWQVVPSTSADTAITSSNKIPANLYGWRDNKSSHMAQSPFRPILKTRPLSFRLFYFLGPLRYTVHEPDLEWLFYRGATWCYLSYLAVGLFAWARRRPGALLLAAPLAGQQLGVLLAIPAPLFRYMASPVLVGVMMLPLLGVAVVELVQRARRAGGVR